VDLVGRVDRELRGVRPGETVLADVARRHARRAARDRGEVRHRAWRRGSLGRDREAEHLGQPRSASCSTWTAARSPPQQLLFMPAARKSAMMPTGSALDWMNP
jgi:hypothetical protein